MSDTKEAMLIALLQETQDADVANALFTPYYQILKAFLFKQGATEFEIDDVIQDAVISAYKNIGSFKGKSSFKTWMIKIAFTKFIDNQRKKIDF